MKQVDKDRMIARLKNVVATWDKSTYEEPDISCRRCGRVIYCGDLSKLCGKDCYKLQEQNAKSNNLK